MAKCQNCNEIEIPEPIYCCNGWMCGCMGLPIDPPFCDECWQKISGETKADNNCQ